MMSFFFSLFLATTMSSQMSVDERVLRATCRVNVNPGTQNESFGTGTFVDVADYTQLLKKDEVLVVTAGHCLDCITIRGGVSVSLPVLTDDRKLGSDWSRSLSARYLNFSTNGAGGDVGVIAVLLPKELRKEVHLARMRKEPSFSLKDEYVIVGCRAGEPPRVARGSPLQYFKGTAEHAPVLHVACQRRSGDSGGGLFDKEGQLLAVCSASMEKSELVIGPGLCGFNPNREPEVFSGAASCFYPAKLISRFIADR